MRNIKVYVRAGAALAGIALGVPAAWAGDESAAAKATAPNDSQMVVRDPATGALRAPTAEEAATLRKSDKHALRAAPQSTLQRHHVNGAHGVRLTDEFMSYSVMVKQPDGSLKEYCFESKEAADAALKAPSFSSTKTLPTE